MDNLEVHILRELKHHSKFFQSLQENSIEQTQEYENMNAPPDRTLSYCYDTCKVHEKANKV